MSLKKDEKTSGDYLSGGVKKHKDKLRYKNAILTALYNDGIIQQKLKSMMERYRVNPEFGFYDDMLQILFLELAKKTEDQIIERYEEDPRILIGLSVRIMCWKIFSKPTDTNKASKNHSFLYSIFQYSNLPYSNGENDRQHFLDGIKDNIDNPDEMVEKLNSILTPEAQDILIKYNNDMRKLPKNTTFEKYFWRQKTDKIALTNLVNELIDLNKNEKEIMLNKKEIYDAICTITDTLDTYLETRNLKHIDQDTMEKIKRVWSMVNPAAPASALSGCGDCVKSALDICISVKDRLKKLFVPIEEEMKDQVNEIEQPVEEIPQQLIPPKEQAKRKTTRRK